MKSGYAQRLVGYVIAIAIMVGAAQGAIFVPTDPQTQGYGWDTADDFIVVNGTRLESTLPSMGEGFPDSGNYQYHEYLNDSLTAIAHSGSAAGQALYQHVYAYSLPEADEDFSTSNKTGRRSVYVLSHDEIKPGKKLKAQSDVELQDLSMVLIKPDAEDPKVNLRGLSSVFEVEGLAVMDDKDKPLFDGSVELFGKKKGKVKIKTKGGIDKQNIAAVRNEHGDEVTQEIVYNDDGTIKKRKKIKNRDLKEVLAGGELFEVVLTGLEFDYKVCVRSGEEFSVVTETQGTVSTVGAGSGAEINLVPGEAVLPSLKDASQVPEPATFTMLVGGGLLILLPRRRRH